MTPFINVLAQSSNDGSEALGFAPALIIMIIPLAIAVVMIAGFWKTFSKAGEPGCAAIIPFYNLYILCKIAGRPGWWLILMLIPIVSIVIVFIVCIDIAKSFGKSTGFGIGLFFLGIIFFPILGFGLAQYQGPAAKCAVS